MTLIEQYLALPSPGQVIFKTIMEDDHGGAPKGKRNGSYPHGARTKEPIEPER
jgi:hypothetical protein